MGSRPWPPQEMGGEIIIIMMIILTTTTPVYWASLVVQIVKNLPALQGPGFNPWVGNTPWRKEWLPTPVFSSGEFRGQRSLASYSP